MFDRSNAPSTPGDGPPEGREPSLRLRGEGGALSEVQVLLDRMQRGDRDAAAIFVTNYGSKIRRRIRGKLSPAMRRLFDSQEIISTLGRRLDDYVNRGQLDAVSEAQLWKLVLRMANNAVIDKARLFRRLEQNEGADSEFARDLLSQLEGAERRERDGAVIEVEKVLATMSDSVDREILSNWLNDTPLNEIAVLLEMNPDAVRKRWQKIRERLRERLQSRTD